MASFFERLKQRKLFQWALAYVAGAWALMQVVEVLSDRWPLPLGLQRGIDVVLLVGFGAALVLAWYHGEKGRQRVSDMELLILAALLLTGGSLLTLIQTSASDPASRQSLGPPLALNDDRPSIAALPFDNLSPDPDDAYFSAGVHEEILTHLARIAGLKVISRTSVLEYQDEDKNLREIAQELGVNNILEGSVRRAGDRIRITVQLIDARTDEHLWAESYDRDLSDIFAVQSDVARRVGEQLEATLTPDVQARIDSPPTQDPEAYAFYLQALEFRLPDERRGRKLLQAVQRDPGFALAHAALATFHMYGYWWGNPRTEDRLSAAKAALDRAFELDPDLPEAHLAAGYYYYWGQRDYLRATGEFVLAVDGLPNAAAAHIGLARVLRRSGRFEEAVASYQIAADLDPRGVGALADLGATQTLLRRFDEAESTFARLAALQGVPVTHPAIWYLALRRGDGEGAESMLDAHIEAEADGREHWSEYVRAALLQRDYRRAAEAVERATQVAEFPADIAVPPLFRGQIYGLLERPELALAHYDSARVLLEGFAVERPSDDRVLGALGVAYAGLGRRDEAVETALKATALVPPERDAMQGARRLEDLATVYVMVGDLDAALDQLDWLLETPSHITVGLLRADPRWDPLRDHPRFQALLERYDSAEGGSRVSHRP